MDEQTEKFTVVVTSSSGDVLPPSGGGPVITITDDEGKEFGVSELGSPTGLISET